MNGRDETTTANVLETVAEASPIRQAPLFDAFASEKSGPRQQSLDLTNDGGARAYAAVLECQDNLEFLRAQPDEQFKLIVTSPPYNIGKSYEARTSLEEYLAGQAKVIEECIRVLHPQGSICWQVGNFGQRRDLALGLLALPDLPAAGLKLRNRIVWHFGHGLHSRKRLSGRYETINWWTKGDDYTWHLDPIRIPSKYPGKRHFKGPRKGELSGNPKGKNPSDVWEFPNVKSQSPGKDHTPLPVPGRAGRAPGAVDDGRKRRCIGSLCRSRINRYRSGKEPSQRLWLRYCPGLH